MWNRISVTRVAIGAASPVPYEVVASIRTNTRTGPNERHGLVTFTRYGADSRVPRSSTLDSSHADGSPMPRHAESHRPRPAST